MVIILCLYIVALCANDRLRQFPFGVVKLRLYLRDRGVRQRDSIFGESRRYRSSRIHPGPLENISF
jgi:hypothetical protein